MKDKVAVITVTFNTSAFVLRAIEAVLHQTYEVDDIVVVDNNSRQEEKERVLEFIHSRDKIFGGNIHYLEMKENLGGGGGFSTGMEYVRKELNADWYWLMDDDAFPEPDCLEMLLKYKNEKDAGCLIPLVWGIDNQEYQLYHCKYLSKYLVRDVFAVQDVSQLDETLKVDSGSFVGPLVSRRAVEKAGIVDGSLFIYGDDAEYIYRISRQLNVYLIKNAIMNHRDVLKKGSFIDPKAWWKDYYQNRNRLFLISEYSSSKIKCFTGKSIMALMLLKRVFLALTGKGYQGHRMLRIRLLWKSWYDGNKNIRGKTIDPVSYMKLLQEENG